MYLFRTVVLACLLVCIAVSPAPCQTRTVRGVDFPEHLTIAGRDCHLAGVGTRKKLIINVYLGALYLSGSATTASEVIAADEVKRIHLHILYNEISAEQLVDAWNEGFKKNAGDAVATLADQIATFNGYFDEPAKKGDTIVLTYIPGTGTEVSFKGKVRGAIPGTAFMKAVFSIWFGPEPPSGGLKGGMLGED